MAKIEWNKQQQKNLCGACTYNKWKTENLCTVVAGRQREAPEVSQMVGDKSRISSGSAKWL